MADPGVKVIRAESAAAPSARPPAGGEGEPSAEELGYDTGVPRVEARAEVHRLATDLRDQQSPRPSVEFPTPTGSSRASTPPQAIARAATDSEIKPVASPASGFPRSAPARGETAPVPGAAPASSSAVGAAGGLADLLGDPWKSLAGEPDAALASAPDDVQLVQAVLAGRPPFELVLGHARQRLGHTDLKFVPEGQPFRADPADVVVDVRPGGQRLGAFVLPAKGGQDAGGVRTALHAEAQRLGAWLRLEEHVRALREESLRDPLTGAWNRRFFDAYLPRVLEQSRRVRYPVTLMVFDIDGFKGFNDRFGHPAGDAILIAAVRLLNTIVRPSDRVCRVGGDEFAVIFFDPEGPRKAGAHPLTCQEMAERFQNAVNEQRFPELGLHAPGALTISAGLAAYPWDAQSPEGLLAAADAYALESKRQGKKKITIGPGVRRPS